MSGNTTNKNSRAVMLPECHIGTVVELTSTNASNCIFLRKKVEDGKAGLRNTLLGVTGSLFCMVKERAVAIYRLNCKLELNYHITPQCPTK